MANIVVLDSNNLFTGSVQNANYRLIDAGGVEGTYEILDYTSVNQLYNVETGVNDQLHWAEPGALTATIPAGNYNNTTLHAAMKVVMDAASASTFTFTVSVDTGLVTMAIAAGTFNWEWGTVTTRRANFLLGLSPVDTGAAASIAGDLVPDLSLHTHLLLEIPEDGTKNVTLIDGSEHSFLVPLGESFGEEILSRKLNHYQQTVFFASNLSFVNVVQRTEDGVNLVNNPRYVLVLRKIF